MRPCRQRWAIEGSSQSSHVFEGARSAKNGGPISPLVHAAAYLGSIQSLQVFVPDPTERNSLPKISTVLAAPGVETVILTLLLGSARNLSTADSQAFVATMPPTASVAIRAVE